MPTDTQPVCLLHDDDLLEISHAAGTSPRAIVSFTGVGLGMGGIQIREFSKSLSGTAHHLYHVIDKARHWYHETSDRIVQTLNGHLRNTNIESVTCLGNSMGGFGALYFASALHNCRHAIALSPQSSINDAAVPWELRWQEWRAGVPTGHGLDAVGRLDPAISYTAAVGMSDADDLRHIQRLLADAPPSLSVVAFKEGKHALASYLKQIGVLQPFLNALLDGDRAGALAVLCDVPHELLGGPA